MLPQHLQWYDIRESDVESDWEDEAIEDDESDNELMMTDVTAFVTYQHARLEAVGRSAEDAG